LQAVYDALVSPEGHEILVPESIRVNAVKSLDRMLAFSKAQGLVAARK
jgi:quinolinate synthase